MNRSRYLRNSTASLGMNLDEVVHLKHALTRVLDHLSDRQLKLVSEEIFGFLRQRGAFLEITDSLPDRDDGPESWKELRSFADHFRQSLPRLKPTKLDRRLEWLGTGMGLAGEDIAILATLSRIGLFQGWRKLIGLLPYGAHDASPAILAILGGHDPDRCSERLGPTSDLVCKQLINIDSDGELTASSFLMRIARANVADEKALMGLVMPASAPSQLVWEDFDHIRQRRDVAAQLVKNAAPVNILLYGPPGTGKTELAKLLACQAGRAPLFAGLSDEYGNEPTRSERLAHFALLRGLNQRRSDHLIVVDEADDLLRTNPFGRERHSKLWVNKLLENPDTPTVWITNEPEALGEAAIRRMSIAIAMEMPPRPCRGDILERQAHRLGMAMTSDERDALASLEATPAITQHALSVAQVTGSDAGFAREVGESLLRAMGRQSPSPRAVGTAYDPSLANADIDLASLVARLGKAEEPWSMLLSGPPGTGKSAFAVHLAEQLERPVLVRRGSDLLGKYVGETEKRIAQAFRQSGETGAVLVIDEADCFLFDRQGAERSWERGMVSEMLRWMEELQSPFVATTNSRENIDKAAMRRFVLKIAMRPLDHRRSAQLFERYFKVSAPGSLRHLRDLTPSDFAAVAKKLKILGPWEPDQLVEGLQAEAMSRTLEQRPIGFRVD